MKTSFLKNIFYPPNYLFLPVAGIEICNGSIKYIEFFNKNGVFSIKKFGEVSIPKDTVKNGFILNRTSLVKALLEVKKNITSDFVRVSIPEDKTYIFETKIPKGAENNIREVLEFKIEENVPLKLEGSMFEYEIIDRGELSDEITVSVSVIPKRVIVEYAETFDQAGMYPVSYEIESKVIANSVITKNSKKNSIILEIKDDSTVLIAVIDGFVRASSSVSIGESAIKESLLKTGVFSDELINGKFFENDFSFETTYSGESYSSLVNVFSILKDEVEKFNEYIKNRFLNINSHTRVIDSIILCGRSSVLPGLAKQINQNINTEVILADTWTNIFDVKDTVSPMKFNDSLAFATPIGLVLSSCK